MFSLVTTRFNLDTFRENVQFRLQNPSIQCIYGSPQPISSKIPLDSTVFVIEMNNSLNQVEGIGIIKNYLRVDRYIRLYEKGNYNRYVYRGFYRLNRDEIDGNVLEILDYILFREKSHLKRGSGFTLVPTKLLHHEKCNNLDIKFLIKEMFIRKFKNKSTPPTPSTSAAFTQAVTNEPLEQTSVSV